MASTSLDRYQSDSKYKDVAKNLNQTSISNFNSSKINYIEYSLEVNFDDALLGGGTNLPPNMGKKNSQNF